MIRARSFANATHLLGAAPLAASTLIVLASGCRTSEDAHGASANSGARAAGPAPIAGATACDELIRPGERHFAHLWKVTSGVVNAAEGYWSFGSDRLTFQATIDGTSCDRILATDPRGGAAIPISNGLGVTTCSYFLPGDRAILYASTHAFQMDCPPPPDMSRGYVWPIHPEYDIYVHDLASGREQALTTTYGYDAEATVSPKGDRIVFTSTRSGDLELWTCDLSGGDLKQVTHELGYDGGAFFSHDGQWLVFRATAFDPKNEASEREQYQALLKQWLVKPSRMEIMVCRPDGSERRRVTNLGKANFAPFFTPDDRRIVFASNHHDPSPRGRDFDVFVVGADGEGLEPVTRDPDFDGFPMFSPDGRWFVFASNRGGRAKGETNLYVAEWRD